MCGIVGIVAANGRVDPRVLQRMNDLVAHRGPDGEGFLLASGDWDRLRYSFQRRADDGATRDSPVRVGLGHRRLAILDLSDRGLQPMCTPDGRTWIVFNGEIYNHREIRSLLESAGHRFTTQNRYRGSAECLRRMGRRLRRPARRHVCVCRSGTTRTRACSAPETGWESSRSTTRPRPATSCSRRRSRRCWRFQQCRREADDHAVVGFLAHGNCDYADRTLFRDVQALPAAHTLTIDAARPHVDPPLLDP